MESRLTRWARISQEAGETVPRRRSHYLNLIQSSDRIEPMSTRVREFFYWMALKCRVRAGGAQCGAAPGPQLPLWGRFRRGRIAIEADLPHQPACLAAANPPPLPTTIPPASR